MDHPFTINLILDESVLSCYTWGIETQVGEYLMRIYDWVASTFTTDEIIAIMEDAISREDTLTSIWATGPQIEAARRYRSEVMNDVEPPNTWVQPITIACYRILAEFYVTSRSAE